MGVAGAAQASFEMLLSVDFSAAAIRRYDGQTGAFLGSFGAGYMSTPAGLTINQSRNEAYVHDRASRRIFAFNYNTGEYLRDFDTGSEFYSWISTDNSGNILISSTDAGSKNQMRRYSPTGTLLNTWNMPAVGPMYSAAQSSNGSIWAIDNYASPNSIHRFGTGSPNALNSYSLGGTTGIGGEIRSSNGIVYFPSGSGTTYSYFHESTPTTVNVINLSSYFGFAPGIGFGHGNIAYFAGSNAADGVIYRRNLATGFMAKIVTAPGVDFSSLAVVVAPEPATCTILTFGVLAALRRRRSSP